MSYPQLLYLYYRLTPIFLVIDVMFSASVRASFIATPNYRYAYYAFCFACGILFRYKPSMARPIALTELSVNFTLVLLSIMMPYLNAIDAISAGLDPSFDANKIVNLGLSGGIMLLGYYSRGSRHEKNPA